MAATLNAAGAGASGQQPIGTTKHYQTSGKTTSVSTIETIMGYDSGTILGTVPPGKPGLKQSDGTPQRSHQIVSDATAGVTGNHVLPTSGVGLAPVLPTGFAPADGLSLAPNHE